MSPHELTAQPQGLIARTFARLRRWLEHPHADRLIVLAGFVALLASLDTGLAADDYLHTVMLDRPSPEPAFQRSPFDIFRFVDPQHSPELLRVGLFSWWDDPHTKLIFMRPVTSLTHWFDHEFFRNVGWFMHLHSALWALLLFLGARALYRDLFADRLLANLALALYALDDARGWLVSWVAARNAGVATALSIWTLVVYQRGCSGRLRWAPLLGPLLLALALLAGEGSLAICGYLAGYALFADRGPLRARALRLAPYVLVGLAWRVAYKLLDYGVSGSSLYVDPQTDPLAYLRQLFTHAPLLLSAQFGGMWSDTWTLLFLMPRVSVVVYALSLACAAWVLWLMLRSLRDEPRLYFALTGMLVSLIPACAVFTSDRLLTWVAIGASAVLAHMIAPVLRGERGIPASQRVTMSIVVTLYVLGLPFLPSRARANELMRNVLDRVERAIPRHPSIAAKTLIFVNPPLMPLAGYPPIERAALGIPRPRAQHVLAIGTTEITVERLDARTLRLSPRDGFLLDPASKLMWSERRPFRAGEQIVQGDMVVRVTRVTADRRPLEIEATFAKPLEDPSYIWFDWRATTVAPFKPPAVGARVVLEGAEYMQAIFGSKLPFEARL